MNRRLFTHAHVVVACTLFLTSSSASADGTTRLKKDVTWEQLNPARGDKSPNAATLWGDRNGTAPTGFLFNSPDGFQSPPHIHNVSYRGIVISGRIHNADPTAAPMWMPPGSYWTQPAGQPHVTAAKGSDILAYIEIEKAPYLVRPVKDAFDNGERPINVDAGNIVWLDAADTSWLIPRSSLTTGNPAKIAFLWGPPREGQLNGTLLMLPAGFSGELAPQDPGLQAVGIAGQWQLWSERSAKTGFAPGSFFAREENRRTRCRATANKTVCSTCGPRGSTR